MEQVYLAIPLAPLFGAIVAGLFGRQIGRAGAHWVTTVGVGISFLLSLVVLKHIVFDGAEPYNGSVYTWMVSDGIRFEVGFLVDKLTALMITVVSFVSLMVHIYTIGYMHDDPGYQRFFSYIALFTFSMLMLVMANNFMQLFFGWEAVGLVSYLLIGFWYTRESAIYANLKAFLVNRVGDFGFLLGIAVILAYTGSLDYSEVFARSGDMASRTLALYPGAEWSVITLACILLFIGAMGKSAQMPLHVWLPDSMEGPTPISALIHAATMVTAGIFMVARMSPLFELSEVALTVVMVIGALTAFMMGLVGIVQNDIKRVIAYSTLSQLGYMTTALGASAYAAGIFHLATHAFFKALLFLAAGSVIIAMHHEQDMRHMGGLRKYMPITFWTALIGTLALTGIPGFAGFFSKDAIIEAVHASEIPGSDLSYWLILLSVFVTSLYSFRLIFLVFFGEARMDAHTRDHLKESAWVVTVPLVLLAIPSVVAGYAVGPMLFGGFFDDVLYVAPEHNVLAEVGDHYHGVWNYMIHGMFAPPFWLAIGGLSLAWFVYMQRRDLADWAARRFHWIYKILVNKYGFDEFNDLVFAAGGRALGRLLWRGGDVLFIDGLLVNGTAKTMSWAAGWMRQLQSGYLYQYAFAMILGLLVFLSAYLFV